MLNNFINKFKTHIKNELAVEVRMYTGAFDDKDTMEGIIKAGKNIIFIDFNSDTFTHLFKKNISISLYYVACTPSKNETYRIKAKEELMDLIENIDNKFLSFKTPNNINTPNAKSLKKLQDGFMEDFGYVVVYERVFEVELIKEVQEEMV
ncbi:MAG: hypothetical protein ACK5LP_05095 [Campylobacteraceae bacterium]